MPAYPFFVGHSTTALATSPDGATWTSRTHPFSGTVQFAYSPALNLIVGASSGGQLATSPDGETWTTRTNPFGAALVDVCWAEDLGEFAILSASGIATSPNGVTWTAKANAFSGSDGRAVARGAGLYVMVAPSGIRTSTDGDSWSSRLASTLEIRDVEWSDPEGMFVAVGDTSTNNGRAIRSSDGISWTTAVLGLPVTQVFAVCWADDLGLWAAVAGTRYRATSADAITWSTAQLPTGGNLRSIDFAEELGLLSVGGAAGTVQTSPDASTWTSRTNPFGTAVVTGMMWTSGSNVAPDAPNLTSPVGGAVVDRTADILLQGGFSDDNIPSGDQLSEVTVEYRQVGGSWTTVVEPASGQTFTVTIPANTLSAGSYEWRAKTKDAAGLEGPFSATAPFTAAAPPAAPVITAPAAAATIIDDPSLTEWTAPNQDAYQVQTRSAASGGGTLYHDSGTVVSTAREYSTPRPVTGRTEWTRVRVRFSGLWSPWAERDNDVSYIPPPTPFLTVAANVPTGAIRVSVNNPAPTGGQPDIAANEIQRQQSEDGSTWADEDGTVDAYNTVARDVVDDGSYADWRVAPRMSYRYRVRAVGDNGTSATSIWKD